MQLYLPTACLNFLNDIKFWPQLVINILYMVFQSLLHNIHNDTYNAKIYAAILVSAYLISEIDIVHNFLI